MTTEAPPETPTSPPAEPPLARAPRPRRRRLYVILAAVVTVLAAAGVTTGILMDKYAYPPSLTVQYFGWSQADGVPRDTRAGAWSELSVAARPRARQTFYLQLVNYTRVSQTVLGLPAADGPSLEHPSVAVSTTDSTRLGDLERARYARAVTIPPGQSRYLRYSFTSPDCSEVGRHSYYDSLTLRIRVGWITREHTLDFRGTAMGTYGTATSC